MAKPSLPPSLLAGILLCVASQTLANPCVDKSWLTNTLVALGENDGHGLGGTGNRPSEDGHGIGGTGHGDDDGGLGGIGHGGHSVFLRSRG